MIRTQPTSLLKLFLLYIKMQTNVKLYSLESIYKKFWFNNICSDINCKGDLIWDHIRDCFSETNFVFTYIIIFYKIEISFQMDLWLLKTFLSAYPDAQLPFEDPPLFEHSLEKYKSFLIEKKWLVCTIGGVN